MAPTATGTAEMTGDGDEKKRKYLVYEILVERYVRGCAGNLPVVVMWLNKEGKDDQDTLDVSLLCFCARSDFGLNTGSISLYLYLRLSTSLYDVPQPSSPQRIF
jgi:hypothetical protein